MTLPALAPVRRLPEHPGRFRLARAGIHQVWQYDQSFDFGAGRLLLRGKNGAGKSKALEMLLPFLLDGDPRRIDATGGGKTTLKWLMLDGWTGGTNRLGYLWLEFVRQNEDGERDRLTVGVGIKASTSTGDAKPTYFVTPLSAVDDLLLPDQQLRPSLDRLRELVGPEHCYQRAADYRARVARELFGITELSRYRNLVHLLHGLRRPTIGDRIEAGELAKVLTEGLPPLDDDVIDEVARNLDDLESVRAELARLERTDAALTMFLRSYRGYVRGVLRGRVEQVDAALAELSTRRRRAGDATRELAAARRAESAATAEVDHIEQTYRTAEADLRALRDTPAHRALGALADRRRTVEAMAGTSDARRRASELACTGERTSGARLCATADEFGSDLGELGDLARQAADRARGCGLDDGLLADAPTPVRVTLAAATTGSPAGGRAAERPAAHTIDRAIGPALREYVERLTVADSLARARSRAVEMLQKLLDALAEKERAVRDHAREVERLEGDLLSAREDEGLRGADLLRAGEDYAEQVRRWAGDLSGVDPGPLLELIEPVDQSDGTVAERAADQGLPGAVRDAAHELVDPVLADLDAERDEILATQRQLTGERVAAESELRRWQDQSDPERPTPPHVAGQPDRATGAPLYLLVDFAEHLQDGARADLEAALQASGLLGAWVCADGTVLDPHTEDIVLTPAAPVDGRTLADVLHPAPPDDCPVGAGTVWRLLASIGLDEPSGLPDAPGRTGHTEITSRVGLDGTWRLGVASGAFHKAQAEYVGAGARAATRARYITEYTERVAALDAELQRVGAQRDQVDAVRDGLRTALRRLPPGTGLTQAWAAFKAAAGAVIKLSERLTAARRAAEQARAAAAQLRANVLARASADDLPAEPAKLAELRASLALLRPAIASLTDRVRRLDPRLARLDHDEQQWRSARDARVSAESDHDAALDELAMATRELRTLEESIGASEQDILAREAVVQRALKKAESALRAARRVLGDAHDEAVRADVAAEAAATALSEQEQRTVDGSGRLRRPLGIPGLIVAAELADLDAAVTSFDDAQAGGVRDRIAALRALAETVTSRLGPASADVGDSAILRRAEELREGLAGGFDAAIDEIDGIKRVELHDDIGTHDVAVVGRRIRLAAEDARTRLSSREQEVFERYLLGELGDHLAQQVLAADRLVKAMNATLDQVRSSHGIGARLVWALPQDVDADIKAAVALLRRSAAIRSREENDQLRVALRGRIERERQADPSAGYGVHLRAALDYRSWFAFTVRVTDAARPDRERVLSHRTALSQGEQRVVSYVVLFAAAAAHFSSIGQHAPTAPRLILLDDAFAKVDEPTHGALLGLLVDLDLDFICTSERLWGCFPTVPSLHIYECLRDPARRGVATVHYTWDGRRKRLQTV